MVIRLLGAGMFLFLAPPALAGTIAIVGTAYPDSVVIDVTVEDTGGGPDCQWFALTRFTFAGCADHTEDVYYFPRPGGTATTRFVDTDVSANTLYCYGVDGRVSAGPDLCDLCSAFDCSIGFTWCVNTGPGPGYIGRGTLSQQFERGAWLTLCECGAARWLETIPYDAEQYLGTDVALDVYGYFYCCWPPGHWLLNADVVVPQSCDALAVEKTTWGRVKALYRE